MKAFLLILFIGSLSLTHAAPGDTTWARVHDKTQLTWNQRYTAKGLLPDGNTSYHQILMYFRMGCAVGGCSDWDYTTRVNLLHPTGELDSSVVGLDTISTNPLVVDSIYNVFKVIEKYELARMITPYGGSLPNDWEHDFMYDLTDYYSLLKDSVEIEVHYQGWSSGFSATTDFAFIEGPRARDVIAINNVYMGSGSYYNSQDYETNHLPARTIDIDPNTAGLDLKVNFSGHGFINALNCAEFCQKDYYVKVGGQQIAAQSMWRNDCGLNPIWPQAGTWLYDRANWCPGDKSLFRHHDLSSYINGSTLDLDIDIEAYSYTVPPGETPAGYNYSIQLIQYAAPKYQNDISLDRIIAPSNDDESGRLNPVCGHAIVRIQNRGTQSLTSCDIDYGIRGQVISTFNWTGQLAHMEYEDVWLPFGADASDWYPAGGNMVFVADASNPNGMQDEMGLNNFAKTSFDAAPEFPGKFTFYMRTNNAANETHWTLVDINDSVLYSGDGLTNNTVYNNNFDLAPGCYTLIIKDRDKDGMSFFGNQDGNGIIRLIGDAGTNFFRNLVPNFGTEYREEFTVGFSIGTEELRAESLNLELYPNPASNQVLVNLPKDLKGSVDVLIYDLSGRVVMERHWDQMPNDIIDLNVSGLPAGNYLVSAETTTGKLHQKLIIE